MSRRDDAVRRANELGKGAGGLSSIDAALRENRSAGVTERPVDRLFKTMDTQGPHDEEYRQERQRIQESRVYSSGKTGADAWDTNTLGRNRALSDPYHPVNNDQPNYSDLEADEGLADQRYDPLQTHLTIRDLAGSINNADAAAYQTSQGIDVHMGGDHWSQGRPVSIHRTPSAIDTIGNGGHPRHAYTAIEQDVGALGENYEFRVDTNPVARYGARIEKDPKLSDQQFNTDLAIRG